MPEQPDHRTDWRTDIDWDAEERTWELRAERRNYPNLRADLQPRDSDDESPPRAEASPPAKGKGSS